MKKQALVVRVEPKLPLINVDPKLIEQVFVNLLTNAIKYTSERGSITICINVLGQDVVVEITDTGFGIPQKDQARVFQKFFRADNIAKLETDGTGLGLYLVKAIIESSGGKIWFTSQEGKGTSFFWSIPITGSKEKTGEISLTS